SSEPATGVPICVLAILRSEDAGPTVLAVDVTLFPKTGSGVPDVTVAVLVMTVPGGVVVGTLTTNCAVLELRAGTVLSVHVRSPAPPAGAEQADPATARWNTVPAGAVSDTTVLVASLGPASETVIV